MKMQGNNRKRGVAVIVVLGVLALLMVLGVAFSVSMRVERAGAANYTLAVKNRQLVWAGLAEAVAGITKATTNFFPPGDFLVSRTNLNDVCWNINGTNGIKIKLLSGQVEKHVPNSLLPTNYFGNFEDKYVSEWIQLRSAGGMGGHVAYLVLNVSDLLDINVTGGGPARGAGTNAAEVRLRGLLSDPQISALNVQRTNRFESLAEFKSRLPSVPTGAFIDYSRYPLDANRTNALYIGGTVAELEAKRSDIVQRLAEMVSVVDGGSPNLPQAGQAFDCLLDYLDTNSTPRNLLGPNTEAVPMLNEISPLPTLLKRDGNKFGFLVPLGIETWYPFVQTNISGESFRLSGAYEATGTLSDNLGGEEATHPFTNTPTLLDKLIPTPTLSKPFAVQPLIIFMEAPITPGSSNWVFQIKLAISNLIVKIDGKTNVVDSVGTNVFEFSYNEAFQNEAFNANPALTPFSYQTRDPRFNWRKSDWVTTDPPTLGTNGWSGTNAATTLILSWRQSINKKAEWNGQMHASNQGRLYSPLELGNIPYSGKPWETFRVFNQGATASRHLLLENFTTTTNPVGRGLVNLNTFDPVILTTAFTNMPNPYTGGAAIGGSELAAITDLILSARASGTEFTNVTDVLNLNWRVLGAPALANKSDVELEALAAYSMGLLGVRQNLFLIVVTASSAEEGMGTYAQFTVKTQSRKTAVVLLWRDPVKNAAGLHDCFVQYFKWMDD